MVQRRRPPPRKPQPLAFLVALGILVALCAGVLQKVGVLDLPSASSSPPAATRTAKPGPEKPDRPDPSGFDEAAAAKDYPGDGAPKKAIAQWMGRWAVAAGLPRELPVMAALVESNLRNAPDGDRDSVGYFQMRTSIWLGDYPGYPSRPARQLKWFVTTALKVKHQREARGWKSFVGDDAQWGAWVADVERPEERYRGRYQQRLPEARQLLR